MPVTAKVGSGRSSSGDGSVGAAGRGVRGSVTGLRYTEGMGKANRQRRAAKVRKRARQHRAPSGAEPFDVRPRQELGFATVADRFRAAVYAALAGADAAVDHEVERLAAHRDGATVALEIAGVLERRVRDLWDQGWQPADLGRSVRRECGKVETALARWVIASEGRGREELGARVAPGWMAQLRDINATPAWNPALPYLLQLNVGKHEAVHVAVRLMGFLIRLPELPELTRPPSGWRDGDVVADPSLPSGVLHKVRALLSKAESTAFDAEAEAFTAKAQELMARHRIDRALLDATTQRECARPAGRRIGLDDPYADAKAVLLGGIADANGCTAVWSKDMGFSTVFGFAGELEAVEELFTSLLVQATAALRREGSRQDQFGRSRTTRFRRSFLIAFAVRVGQRLRQTVDATVEASGRATGSALVPILAARNDATRAAAKAAFSEMRSFAPTATDGEGWYLGTLFGDQADLARDPRLAGEGASSTSTRPSMDPALVKAG